MKTKHIFPVFWCLTLIFSFTLFQFPRIYSILHLGNSYYLYENHFSTCWILQIVTFFMFSFVSYFSFGICFYLSILINCTPYFSVWNDLLSLWNILNASLLSNISLLSFLIKTNKKYFDIKKWRAAHIWHNLIM